jgi:hypothetical protein
MIRGTPAGSGEVRSSSAQPALESATSVKEQMRDAAEQRQRRAKSQGS